MLLALLLQAIYGIRSERMLIEHSTTSCCSAGVLASILTILCGTPPH